MWCGLLVRNLSNSGEWVTWSIVCSSLSAHAHPRLRSRPHCEKGITGQIVWPGWACAYKLLWTSRTFPPLVLLPVRTYILLLIFLLHSSGIAIIYIWGGILNVTWELLIWVLCLWTFFLLTFYAVQFLWKSTSHAVQLETHNICLFKFPHKFWITWAYAPSAYAIDYAFYL